ncbi:MAG: hypothetical protein AAGA75_16505 [Cyanobacteria bacterium P01_E01_bin.6]
MTSKIRHDPGSPLAQPVQPTMVQEFRFMKEIGDRPVFVSTIREIEV